MQPADTDIAAMDDPVVRNLWITQRYHELAVGLGARFGPADATWCAFATWASKTAGATIRNEELPARIRVRLADAAPAALGHVDALAAGRGLAVGLAHHHLLEVVDAVCGDVSSRLAEGNRLVFAELAPVFSALLTARDPDVRGAVAACLARLRRPGLDLTAVEAAFGAYRQALDCGPGDRCLHLLEANVQAVAHEQQRLQPAIAASLDAGVRDTFQALLDDEIGRHLPGAARRVFDRLVADVARLLDDICQEALTEVMLRLVTADERFDLRRDVPPLDGVLFPPALSDLGGRAPAFARWDRTGGTGRPTGAHDWALLDERMNYIANLFRSRQRHRPLLDPPFSADQLAGLRAGHRPSGPL